VTLAVHVLHLWLSKEPSLNDWQKIFVEKNAYPLVMYTSASLLLGNIAFYLFWGDQASLHPHEAD
jgi:hypothetical protein